MKDFLILLRNTIILLLALSTLVLLEKASLAGQENIKINEVMYDPVGTDLGNEWIELYNPNSFPITFSNWKIQVAGTTFVDALSFSGTIAPQSYFTICEQKVSGCSLSIPKLGFQNGGSETDGVQILDNLGNIVDQVFYDSPNSNNLTNQDGIVVDDDQTALVGDSGESLGRYNFIDSDNSREDFYIFTSPTLGAENTVLNPNELPQTGQNPFWLALFIIFLFSAMLYTSIKLFLVNHGKEY